MAGPAPASLECTTRPHAGPVQCSVGSSRCPAGAALRDAVNRLEILAMVLHQFLKSVVRPKLFRQLLIKLCHFTLVEVLEYIVERGAIPRAAGMEAPRKAERNTAAIFIVNTQKILS